MSLPPASGTGRYFARAAKSIRLIRQGCTNRPFFHISVTHVSRLNFLILLTANHCNYIYIVQIIACKSSMVLYSTISTPYRDFLEVIIFFPQRKRLNTQSVIEQLGSYDPMPNTNNEKLVALNLERIKFWMGQGAHVTDPVAELLGKFGIL